MKKSIFIVTLCTALALTGLFMFGCETGETNSSTEENVNAYITATLDDMATTWSELEDDYDLSAYLDSYTAIKTAVENAETKESVDEQKTLFNELADEIVKNAKPKNLDPTPEEIAKAKTAAEKRWEDIIADYDQLVDLQNYNEQYTAFMAEFATVKTAAELSSLIEQINAFFDSTCEYCRNQPIQQEYKELITANMQSLWNEYLVDYPELADTEYKTQIDALIASMQSAEYIKDAEDIYADFTDWVNDVENKYKKARFDEAAQICLNDVQSTINGVDSAYGNKMTETQKNEISRLLDVLKNSETMEELNANKAAILDYIDSVVEEIKAAEEKARFDEAAQICLNDVQSTINGVDSAYGNKMTETQKNEISRLLDVLKNSETMEELNANKAAILDYIDSVVEEIKAADSDDVKSAKQTLLSKVDSSVRSAEDNYLSNGFQNLVWSDEVNEAETALRGKINNAKSLAELNELETDMIAFSNLLNRAVSESATKQNKSTIENIYTQHAQTQYENLKNNLLLVADYCQDLYDAAEYLRLYVNKFDNAFSSDDSAKSLYIELSAFFCRFFDEKAVSIALGIAGLDSDFNTYMKSSDSFSDAESRFNTVKNALDTAIKSGYVDQVALTVTELSVSVNASKSDLVKLITEQVTVIVTYSDKRQATLPVDESYFTLDSDILQVGKFYLTINIPVEGGHYLMSLGIIVVPDMTNAKLLGSYLSSGHLLETEWNNSATITYFVYDNNYIAVETQLLSEKSTIYYAYEKKGEVIIMRYGNDYNSTGLTVLALAVNETDKTINFYYPDTQALIKLNGYSVSLPENITVYGPYTGKGTYFALIGDTTYPENIQLFCTATICELDKENKKFYFEWVKSDISDEKTWFTWDENADGTEGTLRYDLAESIKNTKESFQRAWNELKAQGYMISSSDEESYTICLSSLDTVMSPYNLRETINRFEGMVEQIKTAYYYRHEFNFSAPTDMAKGTDIETFLTTYFVGQTFNLYLSSGDEYKTIKITRDMLSYNDKSENGYVEVMLKYSSEKPYEGYDINEFFCITVMNF